MSVSGAQIIADELVNRGVDRVYCLHGGHLQPIFEELSHRDVEIVTTRDERAAVYMAHAHYQVTGETGVALATAGPGVTNALTGVANADSYQVPVLLIGGCAGVKQFERIALQEMDQVRVFEPITRWAGTVYEAERIPEYLDLALRKAEQPRPGPSFLNVPLDVLNERLPERALETDVVKTYREPAGSVRAHPAPEAIEAAAEAIRAADQPVAISGVGVLNADVEQQLREFVETADVAYLDSAESRGYLSAEHPRNVNAARSMTLGDADLVVLIGKRFDFTLAYGSDVFINEAASVVQIDADAGEIGRNRPADVAVVGDEAAALDALVDALDDTQLSRDDGWLEALRQKDRSSRERLEEKLWVDDETIHPWRLCAELRERLDDDAYVACDGGDILSFGRIALGVDEPGHWFTSGPFGCLGSTVAFATATAILRPDSQVVGLIGDGSFGFNAMELDTAARYEADVTFVVANNAAWNIDRYDQQETYENVVGTELQSTRYDLLAEAVHGHGEHVETLSELVPALDRALEYDGPAVVDVRVQRDVPSPDWKQGMTSHDNLQMPDMQLLQPWDEAERKKRDWAADVE